MAGGVTGLPIYLSLMLVFTLVAERAHAQTSPVDARHATLQSSLERIAKGSALWRDALDGIRATGRRVIVLTPEQLTLVAAPGAEPTEQFDDTLLAEAVPVMRAGARLDAVPVVVNLALLEARHRARRSLPIEFDLDLDRILVHEIYGHAVPYLLAGELSGRCADPQPRERATDACSIRRENAVRAELGLGRRVDYGLDGLNLSRRH
jgi:hypothetical protein